MSCQDSAAVVKGTLPQAPPTAVHDSGASPEKPKPSDDHDNQDSKDQDADVFFTPIFETGQTELSEDFKDELVKHTYPNNVRWGVVNNPSRPYEGNPTSFYGDTVEKVYEFWKAEFISEKNYKGDYSKDIEYTKFTFIVVDDECMRSDPWEIIVACDAPD
ncbi:MAG: hypothetical protein LQ346_000452 [Caloplaca aetnensis]|nr:MAG: hypothetical protein LQ346_000452 [Caloplaca aetnensis]